VNEIEQARFEKAQKVDYKDYDVGMFCVGDEYFEDVEELGDQFECVIGEEGSPQYAWACVEKPFPVTVGSIHDMISECCGEYGYEDMYERVRFPEGFDKILNSFVKMNSHLKSFEADFTRVVIFDKGD